MTQELIDSQDSMADFAIAVDLDEVFRRMPRKITRKGATGRVSGSHHVGKKLFLRIEVQGQDQWVTTAELAQWFAYGSNDVLIESVYGITKLPKKAQTILVRNFAGGFGLFNPALSTAEGTGQLWDLTDGQRYSLSALALECWKVVGLKKVVTLAQVLNRWSLAKRKSRQVNGQIFGTCAIGSSLPVAGVMFASGAGAFSLLAIGAAAVSVPAFMALDYRRSVRSALKGIESSFAAPDAIEAPPIESSLAQRFETVIARPCENFPINARIYFAALPLSGHHVLTNLDVLDARTQQEATTLLLDNLPQVMDLHAAIHAKTMTESVRAGADERLYDQLKLIDAEVQSLVEAVDVALARQQEEFGHYLDAKLRRSELDR